MSAQGPVILYVSSLEPESGKSLVSLGTLETASARSARVGYFKPVIQSGQDRDPLIEMFRERYSLQQEYEDSYGVTTDQTRALGEHVQSALVHRILGKFEELAAKCDVIVVEGTDYTGASAAFEFSLNAELAANLGAAAIVVTRGHRHRIEQVSGAIDAALASLSERHVQVLGLVINRVLSHQWDAMGSLGDRITDLPVWLLPEIPTLSQPTMADISRELPAAPIHGGADMVERDVAGVLVAAMNLEHVMERLAPDRLIVTPGDRSDVALLAMASQFSSAQPRLAGVLLTGGYGLSEPLREFLSGMSADGIPILGSDLDTYEVVDRITGIHGSLATAGERRLAMALRALEDSLDVDALTDAATGTRVSGVTPAMFERQLFRTARRTKTRIVLPEGGDDRILVAADRLMHRDAVDLTVLGAPQDIRTRAETLGLDLAGVEIIDPAHSPLRQELTEELLHLRQHKGLTEEAAWDLISDVSWFGTLLVQTGHVQGMVSGAAHTTADTVRPALQVIRTKPGMSVVSSSFLMAMSDRVLVFADCAVIPDPNARELADIAISSAATAAAFGIDPRIAMLSYSTGSSGSGVDVRKVAEATELVEQRAPDLPVAGPIQYDAAVDPGVGRSKMPGSPVAGRATVLIFPDLNTGNNTYKAVQRSAGAVAIGPVLQGLRLPVNDLSRGATVDDIVNTVIITAIQAQQVAGRSST